MKVKIDIALNNEICIKKQFENTSTNYIKSVISTRSFVLLPEDQDKNVLLVTKRLHMMIGGYWLFFFQGSL